MIYWEEDNQIDQEEREQKRILKEVWDEDD